MAPAKKKLLIIIAALAAVLALMLAAIPLLEWLMGDDPWHKYIHFAPQWLSADIESDSEYMSLDQSVHYITNDGYTFDTVIDPADYQRYPKEMQLIITWLFAARAGDDVTYNQCFSPEYIAAVGIKPAFTQQKIYDIKLICYKTAATVEGYENAMLYGLRYKIKDNNGTLRMDIGSDAEREQFLTVVRDRSENVYIHGVKIYYLDY